MNRTVYLSGAALSVLVTAVALSAQENVGGQCYVTGDGENSVVECYPGKPILVPGSRARDLQLEEFTGSATILTPEQIAQRQTRNVADVLRDVPGIAVAETAGQTQIRLRGSEANHVLVLIDGIEVSDPGSGEFDIGTLQAEIGSRVEVLRGPQSALYGNDALAGVVAYESASGRTLSGFAGLVEGGTNNTFNAAARYGASGKDWDAALSAVVVSTDGEPNARPVNGNGVRDIGRDSYTISGKGSVGLSDTFALRAAARFVRTEGDFNDQDFGFGSPTFGLVVDSPGVGFENEAVFALVGARLDAIGGDWTHDLSAQIADSTRETFSGAARTSGSESDRVKASYVTAYNFGDSDHTLTFAADYELEGFNNLATFNFRNEVENVGFVGEYRYAGERIDFSGAVRHDVNDRFADATTFRVGAGYCVTDSTRLRAAAGSGVKNPTLNELFGFFDGVFIGNPDLEPEKSTSWEVGVDQDFADGTAMLSVTYFNAELEREIFTAFGPPPTFIAMPANRDTNSERQGVEVALSAKIGPRFTVNAAYTYLDSQENGVAEIRRPESIASGAVTWTAPNDAASVTLVARHNGEMLDTDFGSFSTVTLDDFTLVNLNARVKLADSINAFGRFENLLDETYEQVFSFVSPGRTALIGIEARF